MWITCSFPYSAIFYHSLPFHSSSLRLSEAAQHKSIQLSSLWLFSKLFTAFLGSLIFCCEFISLSILFLSLMPMGLRQIKKNISLSLHPNTITHYYLLRLYIKRISQSVRKANWLSNLSFWLGNMSPWEHSKFFNNVTNHHTSDNPSEMGVCWLHKGS